MRHIILIMISTMFILSCGQNDTTKKESKSDSLEKKPVVLTKVTDTTLKSDTISQLIVTPQKKESGLGQVTFSKNGKTLFYFVSKASKGKIIINGTDYVLKKLLFTKGSYKISGDQVTISTSNCKYNTDGGGDCAYGKFSTITIVLNGSSTTIKNVELQDCPDMENMGD